MPFPAIRVEINGELVAIAGSEEVSFLTGSVGVGIGSGNKVLLENAALSVMALVGVSGSAPKQLSWCDGVRLRKGDRVTFELVEIDEASPPGKVLRTPSSSELASIAEAKRRRGGEV